MNVPKWVPIIVTTMPIVLILMVVLNVNVSTDFMVVEMTVWVRLAA